MDTGMMKLHRSSPRQGGVTRRTIVIVVILLLLIAASVRYFYQSGQDHPRWITSTSDLSPATKTLVRLLKDHRHTGLVRYDPNNSTRRIESKIWLQRTTDRVVLGDPRVVYLDADAKERYAHAEPNVDVLLLYWTKWFRKDKMLFHQKTGCGLARGVACNASTDRKQLLKACVVLFHVRDVIEGDFPPTKFCFDQKGVRRRQLWVVYTKETPIADHLAPDVLALFDFGVSYVLPPPWSEAEVSDRALDMSPFDGVHALFQRAHPYHDLRTPSTTAPYQFFDPFHINVLQASFPYVPEPTPDFVMQPPMVPVAEKRKDVLVVWVASNCHSQDHRERFVRELMEYMPVHAYGKCLNNMPKEALGDDMDVVVSQYKFYLAFENSIYDDYVTEKYWRLLGPGVVPVVLGAPNMDRFMPTPLSAIKVSDFAGVKELAEYLYLVGHDDVLYGRYLAHKKDHMVLPSFLDIWKVRENYAGCNHVGLCEAGAVFQEIHNKMGALTSPEHRHAHSMSSTRVVHVDHHLLRILVHARPKTVFDSSLEIGEYIQTVKRTVDGILRQRPLFTVARHHDSLAMNVNASVVVMLDDLFLVSSQSLNRFKRALDHLTKDYLPFAHWVSFRRSSETASASVVAAAKRMVTIDGAKNEQSLLSLAATLSGLLAMGPTHQPVEGDVCRRHVAHALIMSTDAEWCNGAFVALQQIIFQLGRRDSHQPHHTSSHDSSGEHEDVSVRVAAPFSDSDIGGVLWNWCHLEGMLHRLESGRTTTTGQSLQHAIHSYFDQQPAASLRIYRHSILNSNSLQTVHHTHNSRGDGRHTTQCGVAIDDGVQRFDLDACDGQMFTPC